MNKFGGIVLSFVGAFISINCFGAVLSQGPFTFGKGLNLRNSPTDLPDDSASDMCNCVPDLKGELVKKDGSVRFVAQAISSYPVTGLYVAYGTATTSTVLLANCGSRILSSTGGAFPQWRVVWTSSTYRQLYNWITMIGQAIVYGSNLTDDILQYDIASGSVSTLFSNPSSSDTVNVRAKYAVMTKNYHVLANVTVSTYMSPLLSDTTAYPSRLYYSILNQQS